MKIKPSEISPADVGCICALEWTGRAFGFTGHSARHGLEGSGTVSCPVILVGRLCHVSEDRLLFLNAWKRTHPHSLSMMLGPQSSLEYDVYSVARELIKEPIYVNVDEASSSIRQHFQRADRKSAIWQIWPRLKRDWAEL